MTVFRPAQTAERTAFSCVVDNQRRFHRQAALWVTCLRHYQDVPKERIVVHLVAPAEPTFERWLGERGVRVVHITPFDTRSVHCNKLAQLATDFGTDVDRVVLLDCDTVWLGRKPLPSVNGAGAKIVDKANPAASILERIFVAAGFSGPNWTAINFPEPQTNSLTDRNNCNGGVYVFSRQLLPTLADVWPRWARWCLDERTLFGRHINFDQVSYALAARELGLDTSLLGVEWNYPTHYPDWPLPDIDPQIVHYHRRLAANLEVLTVGVDRPDQAIADFNRALCELDAVVLDGFRSE